MTKKRVSWIIINNHKKDHQPGRDGAASVFATFVRDLAPGPLQIFEALRVGVLLAHLWFCVLVPLKQERDQLSLDGRHVIGGLLAVFADGFQYIETCSGVRWGRKNEY
ncbi:hypothetical protein VTN96DRAFT_9429 [Rasamsonia emersonii]